MNFATAVLQLIAAVLALAAAIVGLARTRLEGDGRKKKKNARVI